MPSRAVLTKLVRLVVLSFMPLVVAAGETIGQARVAISPQRVADAIASAGLVADRTQVEFLSEVSGADRSSLRVVSISHTTSGIVSVKLRCRENRECLPFYVLLHNSNLAVPSYSASGGRPESARSVPDIRVGDRATLILENADLRIRIPVVCMQNGMRGQRIRVASKGRPGSFEGEVIGGGVLKGSL
jgi:hypothetical protein